MTRQLEKASQTPSQKHLHRLRLLPLDAFLETEITLKVPINGVNQEDMLASPLLEMGHLEVASGQPFAPPQTETTKYRLEDKQALVFNPDDDSEFEMLATVPMMVLRSISNQQGKSSPTMESEISGAASNASVVGIGNIAGLLFKYANNILIQRGLHAGFFGLYTLAMSVVTLIASIFTFGMDNAMIRYMAIYKGKRETYLLRSLTIFCTLIVGLMGMLGALLVLSFASTLATWQNKPEIAPFLQLMAPLIPLLCLQTVWLGGLQGLKEFKRRVFIQRFLVPMSTLLLMLIAILFFRNITGVIVVTYVGVVLTDVINLYFLFWVVSRILNVEYRKPEEYVEPGRRGEYEIREWLSFAAPNFLTSIITTVLDSIDTVLLAFYVPIIAVGQYAAALKITGFISMPLSTLNIIFTPTIAELFAKNEKQKLDAMFKVITKWSIMLCLPIFVVSALFAIPLLAISGKDFVAGWPMLIVLAVGDMVSAAVGSVGYMLTMTGHQKISVFNSMGVVILNVVLGIILTQRYGAFGTAISTSVALIAINVVRLVEVRILLKMQPYSWSTLKPVGAALLSALLTGALLYLLNLVSTSVPLLKNSELVIEFALIPVFVASYIGLLALFKIDPEDQVVLDKLRRKFNFGKQRGKKGKLKKLNERSQETLLTNRKA